MLRRRTPLSCKCSINILYVRSFVKILDQVLIEHFMKGAISGVSKTQLLRTYEKDYGWTKEEVNQALEFSKFKSRPARIDYKYFYNLPIRDKAERIKFPFTQMYKREDFLSE